MCPQGLNKKKRKERKKTGLSRLLVNPGTVAFCVSSLSVNVLSRQGQLNGSCYFGLYSGRLVSQCASSMWSCSVIWVVCHKYLEKAVCIIYTLSFLEFFCIEILPHAFNKLFAREGLWY